MSEQFSLAHVLAESIYADADRRAADGACPRLAILGLDRQGRTLWLVIPAALALYVSNFGHCNKTYGSLGAIIGFMTWIYLSAMVVLAGADLNREIERRAKKA